MIFRYLLPLLLMFTLNPYSGVAYATLDAVFANADFPPDQPNRICLGDGTGRFTCNDVSADTNSSFDVALGDVNGDTFLDAVFANGDCHKPNRVCLGDGTGAFTCNDVSADDCSGVSRYSLGVALGDVDGDTLLDAVFAYIGSQVRFTQIYGAFNRVCLGDGTGAFTCNDIGTHIIGGSSADENRSSDVALGDVNGDAFLDAIFANSGSVLSGEQNRVCLGDGTGAFTCSDVSADSDSSYGVALGDVNGDTFLDAVFANSSWGPNIVVANRVCLGDGTGDFTCSDVSADINDSRGVALGDVNGDTFLDAVFANSIDFDVDAISVNRVCLGDGTGRFTCSDVSADTNNSRGIALGDVNGDTFLDAVFANNLNNQICLGDGTGSFTCSAVSADTNSSHGVALGVVTASKADIVDLTGTVENADGTGLCALVLASGQFMFSCNPNGPYSLLDVSRETDGSVKRQVYVDGFFPNVETLSGSVDETVVMMRTSSCPDYNSFPNPSKNSSSAGKWIDISGKVLLQNTQTPVCAIVLANGQFSFTCDGTGSYFGNIPLDDSGQYKLQVYADGFAPTIQRFDESRPNNDVRMAHATECQ